MSRIFFSVVLPTRNRANLLPRSLESVFSQTCTDWELIVVDDGSTDRTSEVLSAWVSHRPAGRTPGGLTVIAFDTPRGVAAARNAAIGEARGEWISFLDDDDEYRPEFLAATRRAIGEGDAGLSLLWTGVELRAEGVDGALSCEEKVWLPRAGTRPWNPCDLAAIGFSYGVTVRRSCFGILGLLDEDLMVAQDTDFLLRVLGHSLGYASIPRVLVRHHLHRGERLTGPHHDRTRLGALDRLLLRHVPLLSREPGLRLMFEQSRQRLADRLQQRPSGPSENDGRPESDPR